MCFTHKEVLMEIKEPGHQGFNPNFSLYKVWQFFQSTEATENARGLHRDARDRTMISYTCYTISSALFFAFLK